MAKIFENGYYRVEHDPERAIARLTRLAAPFPTLEEMARANQETTRALAPLGAIRLLFDLSQGPTPRNDEAFEESTKPYREAMARNFERVAVLVRSAVGVLQLNRLSSGRLMVFRDEAEALKYLEG